MSRLGSCIIICNLGLSLRVHPSIATSHIHGYGIYENSFDSLELYALNYEHPNVPYHLVRCQRNTLQLAAFMHKSQEKIDSSPSLYNIRSRTNWSPIEPYTLVALNVGIWTCCRSASLFTHIPCCIDENCFEQSGGRIAIPSPLLSNKRLAEAGYRSCNNRRRRACSGSPIE